MAKKKTKTATPRLRFPEFRGAEPWGTAKLSTLASRTAVKNVGGRVSRVLTNSAEFGVLDQREYFDKDIATAGKTEDYYVVEKGDYVYNPRTSAIAPVGPISRNDVGEGVMSPLYTVFRFSAKQTDFYRHYFHSTGWHSYLRSAASTGARHDRMSITNDAFMRLPLPVPAEAEQQKIADCLTSLDEVIAAQGRKVEALKAHKRGLMQQLFPREGETRPRLRFPEFRDAPEWCGMVLGDVSTIVRGGSPRPIDDFLTVEPDGLNWLKIGDVDREAKYVTSTEERVRIEALSKTRVIRPGDFILSNSMSFGRPYISTIEACIHDGWIAITRIRESLVHEFLYYSILSERSQTYFANQAAGSGVQNLNKDIIKLLPVAIPSNQEQQRIANCLSSLDTRITAETARLAALKTHKQGLMQQLFPAPEAVA